MLANFIFFVLPVLLLCIGFPIYLILLLTSLVAVIFVADVPLTTLQTNMFGSLDNFPLLAIPFFILAGEIMGQGGIAKRVIVWVTALAGATRGSLPVTTIVSSELFGAMSHTAVGTVAAVGRLVYPALRAGGYDDRFTVSLIASSGAIAVVIPPSIAMILYAMSAQQSAIALFTAGILPSLLIGLVDVVYVVLYSRSRRVATGEPTSWPKIWAATREAGWALGTPLVIFGGIYGGVFTPTEAAGIAAIYSIVVTMFIYRDIGWRELWRITLSSVFLISQILIVVTAAGIYSWLLTTSGIPQNIVAAMIGLDLAPWQTLLPRQRRPAAGRKLPRAAGRDHDPHAAAPAGRHRGRRKSRPFRNHHGGEPLDRHVHAAVRAQPVRLAGDLQPAPGDDLSRRRAVRADQLRDVDADQLRAVVLAGAAGVREVRLTPRPAPAARRAS